MLFTYETVNDMLWERHHNLSGYWTFLSIHDDNKGATVSYMLEDGSEEDVTIDEHGNVTVSDKLIAEMDEIG